MKRALGLLALTLGWCASAQAAVVAVVDFDLRWDVVLSPAPAASSAITLYAAYSAAPGGLEDPATRVFDGFVLTDGDDQRVLRIGANAVDPQFGAFVARATNGLDDDLRIIALGNAGGGLGVIQPESGAFVAVIPRAGPDLTGAVITGLELYVASILVDASAAIGGLNWAVTGELRLLREPPGPVPLPPALPLFAAGCAVLALHRRRQRR